jgi:hypothetical protein
MKKLTLILGAFLIMGGASYAHGDKACCKGKKTECSKEKKEACDKGKGCCAKKDKKTADNNTPASDKAAREQTFQSKKSSRYPLRFMRSRNHFGKMIPAFFCPDSSG